jgi:L-alanine-DL-glutamate epimerase-like enolase superfamily enzyme
MKITEVKPILCHGAFRTWSFVKASTDAGITGWGDATEWLRAQGQCKIIEEDLSPLVIGENPFDIEKLCQKIWVAAYVGGRDLKVAITGIETALRDIVGKALGARVDVARRPLPRPLAALQIRRDVIEAGRGS